MVQTLPVRYGLQFSSAFMMRLTAVTCISTRSSLPLCFFWLVTRSFVAGLHLLERSTANRRERALHQIVGRDAKGRHDNYT